MFAVPGWSLSPTLLKTQDPSSIEKNSAQQPSRTSKKRKRRPQADGAQEVTSSNVADLWSQHVEGIKPAKPSTEALAYQPPGSVDPKSTITKISLAKNAAAEEKRARKKHETPEEKKARNKKREAQRARRALAAQEGRTTTSVASPKENAVVEPPAVFVKPEAKLTPLQAAMRQKLVSARFRHLNQTLYTAPSAETQTLFDTNPTFFEEYHSGFRQQVSTWPENPVDGFVEEVMQRGKIREPGRGAKHFGKQGANGTQEVEKQLQVLPRSGGECTIADLGCGDAKLASQLGKAGNKLHIKVLSYDLQSPNSLVTKADIANLPLQDGAINVAIFCLALMGTNWIDFIEEAWRVLHWKGELWVAEIKSRFGRPARKTVDHSVGKKRKPNKNDARKEKDGAEVDAKERLMVEVDGADGSKNQTDVSAFVEVLRKRGFALNGESAMDLGNKMFVRMRFIKALPPVKGKNVKEQASSVDRPGQKRQRAQFVEEEKDENMDEPSVLKPCLYKIR